MKWTGLFAKYVVQSKVRILFSGMLGYRTKHPWHLVDEAQEKFDPDHTCE